MLFIVNLNTLPRIILKLTPRWPRRQHFPCFEKFSSLSGFRNTPTCHVRHNVHTFWDTIIAVFPTVWAINHVTRMCILPAWSETGPTCFWSMQFSNINLLITCKNHLIPTHMYITESIGHYITELKKTTFWTSWTYVPCVRHYLCILDKI